MKTSQAAERMLSIKMLPTAPPTKYIAGFQLTNGTQVALERERDGIYLWTPAIDTVSSELSAYRERYPATRSRNSNLNGKNAPMLREGRPVDYWRLPSLGHLEQLIAALQSC